MSIPSVEKVTEALGRVNDPEIRRPITELNMVASVEVEESGSVTVGIKLTVAGCPLRDTLTEDIQKEVGALEGVTNVKVMMGVMTDEEREALKTLTSRRKSRSSHPILRTRQPHSRLCDHLRQRRGRQVDRHSEPRIGAGIQGPEGRRDGRRYLRLLYSADARR